MKLLMTTDTIGGVWNYCMDLCAALEDAGVSIALASMGRPVSADQYEQLVGLPHVELFESHYRLCWMEDPWDDVAQAGEWLLSLERDFQPDIIQDRKSTRLNSSHVRISYAVFCLKKKKRAHKHSTGN